MEKLNFEKSFERLEKILEKMNSQELTLDLSLSLYEEANKLIDSCQKELKRAEQKVEILKKNREGELELSEEDSPIATSFDPMAQNPK